ncbi:extracellular solute-binding protein [Aeromicrobium sp.]|uniref:extracellular solute-binding protein n=1 Tax=Aeromicrobium sp. TaxID=1871063 RepID=UPI003D6C4C30
MRKRYRVAGAAMVLALVAGGCGDDDGGGGDAQSEIGEGEGAISILAWPYYAEDGTQDPNFDWVSAYEEATGCNATVTYFGTSDEAFTLFGSGDYDVVSASGDSSMRSVAAGDVEPLNTDLLEHYDDLAPFLKEKDWNSLDGDVYGVPHGWGANVLQFNTEEVSPAPDSWGAVFDPDSPYSGQIAAYDSPIYIADAAVYLMATQPDLGIENPYALDEKQFAAAVDLLKQQRESIGEYWADYLKEISAFETGDLVVGTTWQVIANSIDTKKANVKAILPEEGATGWSDTWMISSQAKSPNCAYAWLNYIDSPKANAAATEYFGEAPNSAEACDFAKDESFCDTFKAGDEEFASKLWYWRTPVAKCLDGRTDVRCMDYSEWTKAWTEIKG